MGDQDQADHSPTASSSSEDLDLTEQSEPSQSQRLLADLLALSPAELAELQEEARLTDPLASARSAAQDSGRNIVRNARDKWLAFLDGIGIDATRRVQIFYITQMTGTRPEQVAKFLGQFQTLLVEMLSKFG